MRLLNTTTLKLENFLQNVPPYVILSHTWENGEVTYDDIDKPYAKDMEGYDKIARCCKQAVSDGFDWVWIDTLCIDKRSSSELSEAINSMYDWYWRAEICYAYLADVSYEHMVSIFSFKSRWFTRGWTLQELLAPDVVVFYDSDWVPLGTKTSLVSAIQSETRVDQKYLLDREIITEASIATKFSWASQRETTRPEDMAYCLLGLVSVNMPMLYGEGSKAFYRLQLELLKKTNEHSIFAWDARVGPDYSSGALCPSPMSFLASAGIHTKEAAWASRHEVTNKGLRIMLPCLRGENQKSLAILNCQNVQDEYVAIWLQNIGNEQYRRVAGAQTEFLSREKTKGAKRENMYIIVEDQTEVRINSKACRIQVSEPDTRFSSYRLQGVATGSGALVDLLPNAPDIIRGEPLQLYEDEFGGLLFIGQSTTFLVVFGQHHRHIWIRLIKGVQMYELRDVVRNVAREIGKMANRWEFVRDNVLETLADRTIVSIVARKSRVALDLWWKLSVTIALPEDFPHKGLMRFNEIWEKITR